MPALKIGIDFDGVLADVNRLQSQIAHDLYGATIPPSAFRRENRRSIRVLSPERLTKVLNQSYRNPFYTRQLRPVPGAIEGLENLQASGHQVKIISSRYASAALAEEWLNHYYRAGVRFVPTGYRQDKSQASRGLDVFLDDDLYKLKPLQDVVPHRFLFSSNNSTANLSPTVTRIGSWSEFLAAVSRIHQK